ncbi:hypothetical protein ACFYU8_29760 [Brevibacillus sp. NPDC003359]|uniref:hypothetical protein n=1 Tax=unclassified Brevibacillus TaxID=2684853 RepID=UPI0036C4CEC9
MKFMDLLLKRLTDNYNKRLTGSIGKLFRVFTDQLQEVKETIETIELYRDIDQARGYTLDKIGRNVLQARGVMNDEEFRKMIKTKIRANLSPGDIETIIEMASVLIGEGFTGVQEMWSVKEHPRAGEPAAILLFVNQSSMTTLPYETIKRVAAGGISVYFHTMERPSILEFTSGQAAPIVLISTYQACGTFSAGGEFEL